MFIRVLFLSTLFINKSLFSVTEYKNGPVRFTRDISELKPSIRLDTLESPEELQIPLKKLQIRAKNSESDDRIEPVQVYIPKDSQEYERLLAKLAKRDEVNKVRKYFQKKLEKDHTKKARILVNLDKNIIKHIDLREVARVMTRSHINVKVLSDSLNRQTRTRKALFKQMKFFLSTDRRINLSRKIRKGKDLWVHKDLLPKFARKMAKKFLVFRGPNCFHAALAFHDQRVTRSPRVNVKREKGYHRAMINYDELWRAINRYFYEVDPRKSDLKYGDMLVFFNIPHDSPQTVNFRWIRHTATYLFDKYTFSKGSKSPNTPYSVKSLKQEWDTWQRYTKNMGVKVYRRAYRKTIKSTPEDLTDWVF